MNKSMIVKNVINPKEIFDFKKEMSDLDENEKQFLAGMVKGIIAARNFKHSSYK